MLLLRGPKNMDSTSGQAVGRLLRELHNLAASGAGDHT